MKILSIMQSWIFAVAAIQIFLIPHGYAKTATSVIPYYGKYEIHSIRNLRGSITPDGIANQWLGSFVEIRPRKFSIRDIEIVNPKYGFESIRVEKEEGNVVSKDFSLFWGVGTKRTSINRILVFEGPLERHAYEKIEVIDKNNLLEIYDGRIYFFRRVNDERASRKMSEKK